MRCLFTLFLVACAPELTPDLPSADLPPTSQSLDLSITPAVPGQPVTWTVEGLRPNETVRILRGIDTTFDAGGCPSFLGGLCIDVVPPVRVFATVTASQGGRATYTATMPATVPFGELAGFQAVAIRGAGGSNSTKSAPELVRADRPLVLGSPDALPNPDPSCDIILPSQYWCNSPNPEIRWSGVPANTVSLMFLYTDETLGGAPHWAVYNMPPTLAALAPGSSGGGSFFPPRTTEISLSGGPWFGACSSGANTYEWRLVALDRRLPIQTGSFQSQFAALEQLAVQHGISEVRICQQ